MIDYGLLYDESEKVKTRFIGFTTDHARYDFGIVYTSMFYGKPLVICMQTNRSTLLSVDDIDDPSYLKKTFNVSDLEEAERVGNFLRYHLPSQTSHTQY